MRKPLLYFILYGMLLGAYVDAWAIATADNTVSAQNPTNQNYSLDWNYIYNYKTASSVAVDHYWILTAAHVGNDPGTGSLVVNGETYTQQEIVFHPTADLALVRYDRPFPGYYLLHEGEIHNGQNGPQRVYDPLVMAGFGFSGSVTAANFTQSGSQGTKRWGTNRGVGETTINISDESASFSTRCFRVDFDLSDTSHEAGGNIGDSGGSYFIDDDGEWKLTGINLYRFNASSPFIGNYAAMIHDYIAWIMSVIVDYDTDMDGLPDRWETQYGSGPISMERDGHLDSDIFTNYEEWIADTDPTNAASRFQILEWLAPTNVTFSSSTNRRYQIEYRTDLVDTNEIWQTEEEWFEGSSPQTERPISSTTSNRFYRIRTKLR